ncbi:MAG: efflux RND transporter periplasmic adaptor subunit [Planctomycetota bacterium]
MRTTLFILVLIGAASGGAVYYAKHATTDTRPAFRTVAVTRGDLLSTISATGTIEPEEVVDIGAQVMGLIQEFGPDPRDPARSIDYGSVVDKGTLLAKIDATPYEAALEQAEATLEKSEADRLQFEAKCEQAEQEWRRAESLLASKAIAASDYDIARANYKSAKANVAVGKAAVRQNKASLRMAKTNLGYTTIKSPVRGVIIDRRVNIGQTVVASLNAPSLFLIAKDLRRMQVWASVNEADIGQIRVDMPVRFTVDAHPGQTFQGKVAQVRMNASMTQNVVTYTVVVTTDNSSGKLLPYLTASVHFEVDKRSGVLLVPNAALRWQPQASQIAPTAIKVVASSTDSANTSDRGCLWIASDAGSVRPLEVIVGASDGMMTEVSRSEVQEGMLVVTGEEGQDNQENIDAADANKTSNPFLPKPPKGFKPPHPPM